MEHLTHLDNLDNLYDVHYSQRYSHTLNQSDTRTFLAFLPPYNMAVDIDGFIPVIPRFAYAGTRLADILRLAGWRCVTKAATCSLISNSFVSGRHGTITMAFQTDNAIDCREQAEMWLSEEDKDDPVCRARSDVWLARAEEIESDNFLPWAEPTPAVYLS